jgi:hypothetical protein
MPSETMVNAGTMVKQKMQAIIEDPTTFGTAILAIVLDNYGTDAFAWEPLSLRMQLKEDFGADLSKLNEDKLWGLIVALTTNQFYLSYEIFSQTCKALNGDQANFSVFSPADPEDLAWGVTEVLLNDKQDKSAGNTEFSHEVAGYTGVILSQNGIWTPPGILSFAEYASKDPTLDLETAFVDDPDMFEAARQNQGIRKQELEAGVKTNLQKLVQQIDSLPLNNRKSFLRK